MKVHFFLMMGAAVSMVVPASAVLLSNQNTVSSQATSQRFNDLAVRCSNGVHPNTLQAIARVESGFNPYAIGVVRGNLPHQPRNLDEAVNAARMLHEQGRNFSMGLMQINRHNLNAYGLTYETVFDPCKNIHAGAQILKACFNRAGGSGQEALQKAFSCYYSGNFRFGFTSDFKGQPPYVTKVMMSAMNNSPHQTIRTSGSPNDGNNQRLEQSDLTRANYVPEPAPNNVPIVNHASVPSTTPNPAQLIDAQAGVVPQAPPKPKQAWDIFEEF